MTKKKIIIAIGVAVTLALVMSVGGLAQVIIDRVPHMDVGGSKLIGVGKMGNYPPTAHGIDNFVVYTDTVGQRQFWDTQFIMTNPNCEQWLDIEWVALISGEDVEVGAFHMPKSVDFDKGIPIWWYAEEVIAEGSPEDWNEYFEDDVIPSELSPHEVWQVSVTEIIGRILETLPPDFYDVEELNLNKYTLEVTWKGGSYLTSRSKKLGSRPFVGWQKEKCWFMSPPHSTEVPGFSISEAEMKGFAGRICFRRGEPYFYYWEPPPDESVPLP